MNRPRAHRFTRSDVFEFFICLVLAGLFVLLSSGAAFGQGNVGINNATPHAKSLLDLTSTDKGLLTPRMTVAQRVAMFPAPDATGKGMLVYQTDGAQGFYYYDGALWNLVQSGGAGWRLEGNTGTDGTVDFLGTTDNQPLSVRTSNTERMRVLANGNVGIGTAAPVARFEVTDDNWLIPMRVRNTLAAGYSVTQYINTANAFGHVGVANPGAGTHAGNFIVGTATATPVAITTNDVERVRVTPTGRVGVGTTAPTAQVEISGNSGTGAGHLTLAETEQDFSRLGFRNSATTKFWEIAAMPHADDNQMAMNFFHSVSANLMTLLGNGNLGLGTTAPAHGLHAVRNTANATIGLRNLNDGAVGGVNYYGSGGTLGGVTGWSNNGNAYAPNSLVHGTLTNSPAAFVTNAAERMRIDPVGNVGIGTSTPGYKLDVLDGNAGLVARFKGSNPAGYSVLHILRSDDLGAHLGFFNPGLGGSLAGNFVMGTFGNAPVSLTTNNTERVRIATDGRVGIGTAAPTSELEVNGYTKLGSNAPAVRMLKLTGTTPAAQGSFVDVAHGVTGSKILSVQILIEYTPGNWIPQSYSHSAGYSANFLINATNIRVYTETGNSANILGRPMKLLITYEA